MTRVRTHIHALLVMLAAPAIFSTMIRPALASPIPDAGTDLTKTANLAGIEDHALVGANAVPDADCWWSPTNHKRHCSACYREGLTKVCKGMCKKGDDRLYCDECGYSLKTGRWQWCR